MTAFLDSSVIHDKDAFWLMLHSWLGRIVRKWVYSAYIPRWRGQEEEVVDDIVGEALTRTCERLKLAEEGKAKPVISIPHFSKTTARNHFIDLTRREPRMLCFSQLSDMPEEETAVVDNWNIMEDTVTDALYNESLFNLLAQEIKLFPKRQRLALLIDLASRTYFDPMPTLLQQAFLHVNVQLEDYQDLRPANKVERRQLASLAYQAYKRLTRLPGVKQYISHT